MTRDETSKYTISLPNGQAQQFVFPIEAKSVITRPSPGIQLAGAGIYEITGVAWSGYGKIAKVDVSADGGKSWAAAMLQEPVLPMALTWFRIPWQWDGGPAVLQSRTVDGSGYVQPNRDQLVAERSAKTIYPTMASQAGVYPKRRVVACLCVGCTHAASLLACATASWADSPDLRRPAS